MEIRAAGSTHKGMVRSSNEDACGIFPELSLYIIADGLGGHAGGEVASTLAVDKIKSEILISPTASDRHAVIKRAIEAANTLIMQRGEDDSGLHGMGTTVVVAVIEGEKAIVAHVGDSRAYLIRNEMITQVTRDHTVVEEYIRIGLLSPRDALYHPSRHTLSRALGTEGIAAIDFESINLMTGDVILLCTDGLTNMLTDKEILHTVSELRPEAGKISGSLIDLANKKGGIDNITVVVLCVM